MKNFVKRLAFSASAFVGAALPALAEEAGGSSTDVAAGLIGDASDKLEGILTTAGGAVSTLVIAGLAIWGAIAIVGVLKRAFSAGKGR